MRLITATCAVLLIATPAMAQTRSPAQRQVLADLSYVIGQEHALAQICRDPDDQYWRERMISLIETEEPDPGLQQRIQAGFNAGYSETRRAYPACTAAARDADAKAAAQGQTLARRLAEGGR